MRQVLLGVSLNTVALRLSAWRLVDSIGPQGHSMSDTGNSFLSGIILLSFIASLAFGVAGINALTDAPRTGAQCPLEQGETDDAAAGDSADSMVQLENRTINCGGAWESELARALNRLAGEQTH